MLIAPRSTPSQSFAELVWTASVVSPSKSRMRAMDEMGAPSLHGFDAQTDKLAQAILDYVMDRIRMSPPPLDGPRSPAELSAATGDTITEEGLGWEQALTLFRDVLAPACISSDHPRYLGFVPTAPAETATLFDLVVSASSIYGDWWIEGAGAIHAENQALRWLAGLAGLPDTAGGVFVSGGTAANLSALTVARETWRSRNGAGRVAGIACAPSAHSSVRLAAKVIDAPIVLVPGDERGRLRGEHLAEVVEHADIDVFAVVATGGATNTGIVDDLDGVADACEERGVWMHVDAAYGGAALVAPSARPLFNGIHRADSFVVDPHKWLFSPFDCAALLYRDPNLARAALTQHAGYLEVLTPTSPWNPSDLAIHMTRRARGLPMWFALATSGTQAFERAVERGLHLARVAARQVDEAPHLELVLEPELSVVLFRRRGWDADDYQRWSDRALTSGLALVVPTVHDGETMFRLCFVNPQTTSDDIELVLEAMR